MIDLDAALADLAEHLDHPIGDDLVDTVLHRIAASAPVDSHRSRARVLLTVAAVLLVIVATVFAIAPARHAVADWLGIGAVRIRVSDHPLPTGSSAHTVPGAPGTPRDAAASKEFAAAQKAVTFKIATPHLATVGSLSGVQVDNRVNGGLVVLEYPRFTLVELATDPSGPTIGKLLDPRERSVAATAAGRPGLWITGAHELAYLDRSGRFETDTVRRSGSVLLWERAGVTYRIEGLGRLIDAQAVADSVR